MQRVLQHHLDEACRAYGIVPLGEYVALRAGYVALVHRVRGEDGRDYVLKTYDDARPISRMILPTLEALTQATVWLEQQQMVRGRIVAPVAHHNPVRSGPYTTVIFPYIDGVTPRERTLTPIQLRNLVHTVAHLHRLPADGAGLEGVPREDFDALWTAAVLPALARIDQPGHVLAAVFAGRAPRLAAQFRRFRSRAAQLATQEHALVVCHTDIHGYNVVIKNDVPLLIDWEGMKVAPKEHDLLFWIADDRWEDIWQQYRLVHPGAQIDTALLDFYGTRRLFEDLIQDIERVEQEHPTGQEFVDLCRQIDYATTELAAKPL
jgi:Ser/Thr protein kinase RdoA (MazF antagonist)